MISAFPNPANAPGSPHNSTSKSRRSNADRHAASLVINSARCSESAPDSKPASVHGISATRIRAIAINRSPLCGDSCRARPTSEPSAARDTRGPPAAAAAIRLASNAAANRACSAAAADFPRSSSAIRPNNAASPASGPKTSLIRSNVHPTSDAHHHRNRFPESLTTLNKFR
ncbi:Uncharacterised protein [Mycobacteroides abscessus subsp. abscessus]|nr:Uncharacterised protein [Mycobacteroides abscessus subsp. abscessus]